jgi:hypothetical protein
VKSYLKRCGPSLWLSVFLLTGCSDSPTAPTADGITLQSITPAAGTVLTAGQRVTFTAVVNCTIANSDGGSTGMVVQDQGNRSLLQPGEVAAQSVLRRGTETVTLSQSVTIPENLVGSTVTVALPIFVNGSNVTQAVVTRQYPIR